MIFLTVGTTKFPFPRMFRAADKALVFSGIKGKLIAQIGPNDYQFIYQNTGTLSEIPFTKMVFYLSRARLVIAHGGAATIFMALKCAKNKPLIVPRSKRFGEHVDDHQIFLAKFLKKKKLIEAVFPDENLVERIRHHLQFPEEMSRKEKISASRRLIEKLIKYTESMK